MIPQELSDYISKARAQGMAEDEILSNLRSNGWKEEDIQAALHGDTKVSHTSNSTYPNRLLGPIELIKAGWARFKSRWQTAVILQAIPAALLMLPTLFFAASVAPSGDGTFPFENILKVSGFIFLMIPVMLVAMVLMYWAQVAQYVLMRGSSKLTWQEAYGKAKPYLWQYFVVTFLVGVIAAAGYIFFIVPGVIASLMLIVAVPVLFEENLKGFAALERSRWYTHGYKVEILKRLGVIALIYFLISIVLGIFDNNAVVSNILSFGIQITVAPLSVATTMVLYENLKALPRVEVGNTSRTGLFKGVFVAGLLIVPMLILGIIAAMVFALSKANQYIYDQKQGDTYQDTFDQYLPENYESDPNQQFNEEEFNQQMEELNRMMQEYGMSPLPSAADGSDANELI